LVIGDQRELKGRENLWFALKNDLKFIRTLRELKLLRVPNLRLVTATFSCMPVSKFTSISKHEQITIESGTPLYGASRQTST
jgi:hypothetical protein